jgi:hypothetical protein
VGVVFSKEIHDRVLERIDVNAGRINARTSGSLAAVRTPLHFPSDRECIDLLAATVGRFAAEDVTMGWVRNTLELEALALTENLAGEIAKNPLLEITGPPFAMSFDDAGNLNTW